MTVHVVSIISRMNIGGPALLLAELFEDLNAPGYRHTLITGRCMENEIDFLKHHNVNAEVIYIDEIRRSSLPVYDLKSLFKLTHLLRTLEPDLIHTHTSKAGFLGRVAAWLAGLNVPLVHTYHGHLLYGYFNRFKTILIIASERVLAKITDSFVSVTNQVKNDLLRVGIGPSRKWTVIHPGVNPMAVIDSVGAKNRLGIPRNKFIIVWIGRFTSIKNPLLALNALGSLDNSLLAHVHMIMVGSGELYDECAQYVAVSNLPVSFAGWISDVNPFLSTADILLLTSRNEGMPLVVIEAALHRVPTVSTEVGGVSEFIVDRETGFLCNQTSVSLAQKLTLALRDESLRRQTADAAYLLANEKFTTAEYCARHDALYKNLLENSNR